MVSALGAWLLLALVAPVAGGVLDEAVGMPAADAERLARELLTHPHPSLRLQGAAWRRVRPEALESWLAGLAAVLAVGDVPDQAGADAWAGAATGGLIERFPLTVDGDTLLVLASAVACSIDWRAPFDVVDAADAVTLRRAPGFDTVRRLLGVDTRGRQFLADSELGLLAVHAARSAGDDLLVVSVSGPPDLAPGDVLAQAHTLATRLGAPGARPQPALLEVDLYELPLGAGHSWTLTEELTTKGGRQQRVESVLPAWSAETELDLAAGDLGFVTAGGALAALVGNPALPTQAVQSAMARYTRTGFEAAAVTAQMLMRSHAAARDGVLRTARLQFVRPYAVVAVARADDGPWAGLPVFSAWVTRAGEAHPG